MGWEQLLTWEAGVALLTLTGLEIILGIDNVIFIAILAGKLPPEQRDKARQLGLLLAVVSRVTLLMGIGWVMHLSHELFSVLDHAVTGKDLVLIVGGLFLIAKATHEIHHKVEGHDETATLSKVPATLGAMLAQVLVIDVVFSLDSVITAVGMTNLVAVMIAAILVSVGVMLVFSGWIVRFVEAHPAIKILALAFLLLIGVLLVAEGFHAHISKNYIYAAMAFSLGVELLQMRAEKNKDQAGPWADPAVPD